MQFPHVPPTTHRRNGSPTAISVAVALTVALVLGGYALALGFTGIPVLVAAVAGMVAGVVLVRALAE